MAHHGDAVGLGGDRLAQLLHHLLRRPAGEDVVDLRAGVVRRPAWRRCRRSCRRHRLRRRRRRSGCGRPCTTCRAAPRRWRVADGKDSAAASAAVSTSRAFCMNHDFPPLPSVEGVPVHACPAFGRSFSLPGRDRRSVDSVRVRHERRAAPALLQIIERPHLAGHFQRRRDRPGRASPRCRSRP